MRYSSRCSNDHGVEGIILLDKPSGLSSNYVLQKVKRLFRVNKAGHTGALDPLASGMLPICLGQATKFSQYLLNADKRYRVTARLGVCTNTSDAEGQIVSIRPVLLDQLRLLDALRYFRGAMHQVPSMFSALKYQGRPLYEYARKGIEVPREARKIYVYDLQLLNWDKKSSIELEIHCSKGTYIRSIIDDLGERLGCGAHVTVLRRLAVSRYGMERMVTLPILQMMASPSLGSPDTLTQLYSLLLPLESAVANFPVICLLPDIVAQVRFGKTVLVNALSLSGLVRMIEGNTGRFFGIGEITESGRLSPRRLII